MGCLALCNLGIHSIILDISWNGGAKSKKGRQIDAEPSHTYFLCTLLFLRRCCQLGTFRLKYLARNLTSLRQSKALLERCFSLKLLLHNFLATPLVLSLIFLLAFLELIDPVFGNLF